MLMPKVRVAEDGSIILDEERYYVCYSHSPIMYFYVYKHTLCVLV